MIKFLPALSAVIVTFQIIGPPTAYSQAVDPAKGEASRTPRAQEAYWSEERSRSATPVEPPTVSRETLERLLSQRKPFEGQILDIPPKDLSVFGAPTEADVRVFPYTAAGKVFRTLGGENKYCSAQVVGHETVVLTAAHCLRNSQTGEWATNVYFFRGFDSGTSLQQIASVCITSPTGWVTAGEDRLRWDYAFVKLAAPSGGGYFGLRIGIPHPAWEAIGYSTNFGGLAKLQRVQGSKGNIANNLVEMLGNPLGKGSSGGAWHYNNYAIGHNSHHVTGESNEWSPLYDDNLVNIWRFALNGCQ